MFRFRFADFELDERRGDLRRVGRRVAIQATPFRLLSALLRNADRVVSRDELADAVWPDVAVADASLATAVRQVRKALGPEAARIETLRRRGRSSYAALRLPRPLRPWLRFPLPPAYPNGSDEAIRVGRCARGSLAVIGGGRDAS